MSPEAAAQLRAEIEALEEEWAALEEDDEEEYVLVGAHFHVPQAPPQYSEGEEDGAPVSHRRELLAMERAVDDANREPPSELHHSSQPGLGGADMDLDTRTHSNIDEAAPMQVVTEEVSFQGVPGKSSNSTKTTSPHFHTRAAQRRN